MYIQSFKTFKQEWGYRESEPEAPTSVASLTAWYKQLDADLVEALSGLSEDDVHNKQIDRGHGFTPSVYVQFLIYHEAVLIFYAKASAYLKALEKPYSKSVAMRSVFVGAWRWSSASDSSGVKASLM